MTEFYQIGEHFYTHNARKDIFENCAGGFIPYDERMAQRIVLAEDWHDLYLKTGYLPNTSDYSEQVAWLSPSGVFIAARAHEITAEKLIEIIDGKEYDGVCYSPGDELIARGWIKVSNTMLWSSYMRLFNIFTIPKVQYNALRNWCQYHKMPMREQEEI